MKRAITFILALTAVILSVTCCDKESLKLYRDYSGNRISLIGSWGLVEVQYWTAGVFRTEELEPESLMVFKENGLGESVALKSDGSRELISTFHWEKYPGSVTLYTEEEFENNRYYTDEDMQYMPGRTYEFRIIDNDTISYREKVSSGSYTVNIFTRF